MYNLTDISKNANNINNNIKNNLHRVGKNVLSSSVELNFNSPKINNLKTKLENNSLSQQILYSAKKNTFPLINKSPILIKDKMGNLPGVKLKFFFFYLFIFF